MITHIEKDLVLNWLCSHNEPELLVNYNRTELLSSTGLATQSILAILTYFQRKGLVFDTNYRHHYNEFYTVVTIEAFDLYNHGGFTNLEFTLNQNLEKLNLELNELKAQFPEKAAVISGIVTGITSIVNLFIPK